MARSSGDRLDFLSRGVTKASLKLQGKVPSDKQRLSRVVIGGSRASRQDLRSQVGRMSSGHVELLEARMIFLTLSREAGEKLVRGGGGAAGGI